MIVSAVSRFKDILQGKKVAYNKVFDRNNVYTDAVLKDLAKFCRAHKSTFLPDARASAVLEGRREVWLMIQEYLELEVEEIYSLHAVKEYRSDNENSNR